MWHFPASGRLTGIGFPSTCHFLSPWYCLDTQRVLSRWCVCKRLARPPPQCYSGIWRVLPPAGCSGNWHVRSLECCSGNWRALSTWCVIAAGETQRIVLFAFLRCRLSAERSLIWDGRETQRTIPQRPAISLEHPRCHPHRSLPVILTTLSLSSSPRCPGHLERALLVCHRERPRRIILGVFLVPSSVSSCCHPERPPPFHPVTLSLILASS